MKLVLFLNMGGVSKIEDCELFLKNMFNDPYILGIKNKFLRKMIAFLITKMRLKAMQKNYEILGGKSPLNDITLSLCEKLNKNENFKFDFVNLYVPPFATEVLKKYSLKKNDEIILFPLYPHHSQTTVTTSLEVLKKSIDALNIDSKIHIIDIFYKDELYNQMIINHILKENENFKRDQKKTLIFSAHSLPVSIIKKGDLYEKHTVEHFEILKDKLKDHFDEILLSYQSKLGPVKWLEPNTSDILKNLKNDALIYPISFCIDCSETVFELDIEYKKLSSKDYEVISCPNDSLEFQTFILSKLSL
ncbi:ferrochelatase [Campylobacter novaezeelandiae]|uniref:ferrochelatase n=1 Tax=Campylobacter novaezeelandiae TaxID=2267891 RepID=UPI001037FD69|nr:ferrochelatase [Campylobacter novaezeelandiae]QWU80374.1 ferrochelatase [Campylobacter novaezeelandiae]TBR77901.1 ferrochelatase [Campylobacter novaezeelandiae]TBR78207.1 ferrochelatase [Campylobacter novaezeelandiae]TBR81174.1 ferrochelatase [Campylobacter novaezeelandiae]